MISISTSAERYRAKQWFVEHILPPGWKSQCSNSSVVDYFAHYGFKVPRLYSEFYSESSGVRSDKYIPYCLGNSYIEPCLNREEFKLAYGDKNNYSLLLPMVRQPETVVKCRNGIFYDVNEELIDIDAAISLCLHAGTCIIKPSIDTRGGRGVAALDADNVDVVLESFKSMCVWGELHRPKTYTPT